MSKSNVINRRRLVRRAILAIVLAVIAVPFVYPLIWTVFSAFKPRSEIFSRTPSLFPVHWTLQGIRDVFTQNPFLSQYFNSLFIAVVVTLATIALSSAAGYAFARIRLRFANVLFFVVLSTLFLPPEVVIIPIFQWVSRLSLLDTKWPLLVLPIFGRGALAVFVFRQAFLALPRELDDAARIDGLARFGMYTRIALPLVRPAVSAVAILTFLSSFNMYLEPLVLLQTPARMTVPVGLNYYIDFFTGPNYPAQLGATALATLPVLIVFLFAQRQFVDGLAHAGLKG